MAHEAPHGEGSRESHSQFALLRQRRFAPYFVVQLLGAFNDNVFRQAIIGLIGLLAICPVQVVVLALLAE